MGDVTELHAALQLRSPQTTGKVTKGGVRGPEHERGQSLPFLSTNMAPMCSEMLVSRC